MKYADYRPARIVKTKTRWYVEYYYRVPLELREKVGKEWQRFRVFEDINIFKTDDYAETLRNAINIKLAAGEGPYDYPKEVFAVEEEVKPQALSLNVALDKFMENCREKDLRPKTLQNYRTVVNYLKEYFLKADNKIYRPVAYFSKDDMKTFLKESKQKNKWQNYTFNNYLGFAKTIFNWFVKEDIIEKSPFRDIEDLPVNITKHKYYDHVTSDKLKELMLKDDPMIYKVCMCVYYAGLRPKSELRFLKIENILADRDLIFIPASISKNRKDDYVQMDRNMKEMLSAWLQFPKDYYLFGPDGEPSEKHTSANTFSNRFKKFKIKLRLGEDFTLYSWKHTRAIDLAEAGADPYQIMQLFRHSSLDITIKYLRGLGCNISSEISDKSRKF